MGKLYRTQVLLEPEQHQALAALARERGSSVSEVLRGVVRGFLAKQAGLGAQRSQVFALDTLAKIRAGIQARSGVLAADLVAEARAEREAQAAPPPVEPEERREP